jgi:cysteine synthase A
MNDDWNAGERRWAADAILQLRREAARSADTHLLHMRFAGFPGIDFYFKDEAAHPTGSLKHRLARSLFLYALCNGRLREGQAVVDASSGSTAISEAWFARLLGLRFIAVMPACTAPGKIEAVRSLGGHCELTADGECTQSRARAIAGGGACFLDQFGLAERATDWRGNNNIAESILDQMAREPCPHPAWIVCGVGTGGTSATIGRYLALSRAGHAPVRGGTGRQRLRAGLARARPACNGNASHVDRRHRPTPGGARLHLRRGGCGGRGGRCRLHRRGVAPGRTAGPALRRLVGNQPDGLPPACRRACAMQGCNGSIVTLLCDRGGALSRRRCTTHDWLAAHAIDAAPRLQQLRAALDASP